MKPFWTGTLEIGRLQVPVGLTPAARDQTVKLRRLHTECLHPITTRAWCASDDVAVADDEVVRGYEVTEGQHVLVTDDDLRAVQPEATRTIEVTAIVPADTVDGALVTSRYLLVPSEAPIGRRPYELVRQVLYDTNDVRLLVRLVVKGSEWIGQVRAHPARKVLILEQLRPVEELVNPGEIEKQLARVTVTDEERMLGNELILGQLRAKPPARALTLNHRVRVRELIDAKLAGEKLSTPAPDPCATSTQTQIPDANLAATLTASIRDRRPAQKRTRSRPAAVKR